MAPIKRSSDYSNSLPPDYKAYKAPEADIEHDEGDGDFLRGRRVWQVRLLWEPRDLWVGVYWDRPEPLEMAMGFELRTVFVFVCLIPCLPIKIKTNRIVPSDA